jgi:hypothetical protein
VPLEAEYARANKTVSEVEHATIINKYIDERQSMNRISEAAGRSSETIMDHIHEHNNAVARSGFCP